MEIDTNLLAPHLVSPILVREIFCYICNRLGAIPRVRSTERYFGYDPNDPLVEIAETILFFQMLLRDFLKRLFTSRAGQIATNLHAAAHDICTTIAENWVGSPFNRVFTMSAVLIELYFYCDAMRITVPDEFFLRMFFSTKLAEDFGATVRLHGGVFGEADPIIRQYIQDFFYVEDYIFNMTSPYQSVPVASIRQLRETYTLLVSTMSRTFNFHSTMNIQRCTQVSLRRIQEAYDDRTNMARAMGNLAIEERTRGAEGGYRFEEMPLVETEGERCCRSATRSFRVRSESRLCSLNSVTGRPENVLGGPSGVTAGTESRRRGSVSPKDLSPTTDLPETEAESPSRGVRRKDSSTRFAATSPEENLSVRTKNFWVISTSPRRGVIPAEDPPSEPDTRRGVSASEDHSSEPDTRRGVSASEDHSSEPDPRRGVGAAEDRRSGITATEEQSTSESDQPIVIAEENKEESASEK